MINCREAVERLWSYLDRNLGRGDERELEAHLDLCRHCCGELEFARQVRGLLAKSGTAVEIPPETQAKLDAFLKAVG